MPEITEQAETGSMQKGKIIKDKTAIILLLVLAVTTVLITSASKIRKVFLPKATETENVAKAWFGPGSLSSGLRVGDTFNVVLNTNFEGLNLDVVDFTIQISYPKDILEQLGSIVIVPGFGTEILKTVAQEAGKITLSYANASANRVVWNQPWVSLNFKIKSFGTAAIALDKSYAHHNVGIMVNGQGQSLAVKNQQGGDQVAISYIFEPTSTLTPTLTPTATAIPPSVFVWRAEAETGTVLAPMEILQDASVSGARFISTCNESNAASVCRNIPGDAGELGSTVFNFSVPRAGDYYLWAKAKGINWSQNSFFVSLDQSPRFRYEIKQHDNQWQWGWEQVVSEDAAVKSNKFTLPAGSHTLRFGGREGLAGLDTVLLTDSVCLVPDSATTNCDSTITPTLTPIPSRTLTPTQTPTATRTPTPTGTPNPSSAACDRLAAYRDDPDNRPGSYNLQTSIDEGGQISRGEKIILYVFAGPANLPKRIYMTYPVPVGLSFVDSDSGCTYTNSTRTVVCEMARLVNKAFRVSVNNTASGVITNVATVRSEGGSVSNCWIELLVAGTATQTPTPTPTGTITITPSLTPTATQAPGSVVNLAFKVKFQGIATKRADQKVRVTADCQYSSTASTFTTKTFYENVNLTSDDNGVYSGSVNLSGQEVGGKCKFFIIKGPKHLARKFCENNQKVRCTSPASGEVPKSITLAATNTLDFSQLALEGGDLPNPNDGGKQDGVVNSVDFGLMNNRLGSTAEEDLAIADLDLNGIVNVTDRILLRNTLETRYEEDY